VCRIKILGMKILVLFVGKTDKPFMKEGIDDYLNRIKYYFPIELQIIPELKKNVNLPVELQKEKEGQLVLAHVNKGDQLVLLDEKGTEYSSVELSQWIEKKMTSSVRQIVFVIGGAYGFAESVYQRADHMISLSKLTFSHQMVRMIFAEQLYRALTIIRNEPYHHK
jgi:23S rRNA (pseudouridine1915-N3)-methyltransferase